MARLGKLSGRNAPPSSHCPALVFHSPLVIMDEPFKGLDEATLAATLACVDRWLGDRTFLLVTHSPQEAERLGCRITRLDELTRTDSEKAELKNLSCPAMGQERFLLYRRGNSLFQTGVLQETAHHSTPMGIDAVKDPVSLPSGLDQTAVGENADMIGKGGLCNGKILQQGCRTHLLLTELYTIRRRVSSDKSLEHRYITEQLNLILSSHNSLGL